MARILKYLWIILSYNIQCILYVFSILYVLENGENHEKLLSHHSFKIKFSFFYVETLIWQHLDRACVTPPHILSLQPSNFILMSSAAIQIARLL